MTTTPVPFKIQNNVMLTSFFTPQNNNQSLNINNNINNNNNTIYLNKEQISQAKVCPMNFKSEEKDDNSTIRDHSMPESSGTDKSSKNNNYALPNKVISNNNINTNNVNNNMFLKNKSLIFVPSPIPGVSNNFYGWIMNGNKNIKDNGEKNETNNSNSSKTKQKKISHKKK